MTNYPLIIVDDDEDDRFLWEQVFLQTEWRDQALLIDSGESLFSYLSALPSGVSLPAVILLDYNMPRYNGEEVLRQIRSRPEYNNIKIVFYSSGMSTSLQKQLAPLHPTAYYRKPGNSKEFLQLATNLYQLAEHQQVPVRATC
jgi:CheY-like chemotaxis protein